MWFRRHRLLSVVLGAVAVAGTGCITNEAQEDSTERDDSGDVVEGGDVGVFRLQEGDCVLIPASLVSATELEEVEDFEAVPCEDPHTGEVVLVRDQFYADLQEFPGEDESVLRAERPCIEALDAYTATSYETSRFDYFSLVPTAASWDALDDRGLVCIGVTLDEGLDDIVSTTGSMRAD